MSQLKNFLLCFAMALFLLPATAHAQIPTSQELTFGQDKKTDKKKEKDVVQIDESFFVCLAINAATVLLIIGLIYYPNYRKMDTVFSFILFNLVIFMLTYVLNQVKISMGAAFGLFAVFSMLRYRTAGISMKEMTYLFIFIAVGLISAIRLEYWELGVIHGILFLIIFVLDGNLFIKREFSKNVLYENMEMVKPDNHTLLIEDLRKRTGLNIHRIVIHDYDFLRDKTHISVYYYA